MPIADAAVAPVACGQALVHQCARNLDAGALTRAVVFTMTEPTVVIMIHGLVGSLEYFHPAARIRRAEVRTIDLLGYGDFQNVAGDRLTLHQQAEHVASHIASCSMAPVWLLGHSMGGAVVMLLAERHPELVCGIINVEGNFTRKDAFWSSAIVKKSLGEWTREYDQMRCDVRAWTVRCEVEPTQRNVLWMTDILDHQPASTVYAMSKAIVKETLNPAYLDVVRRVVDRGIPIHLIAGERSAKDWDVPDFVRAAACSNTTIPGTGHVMMLDDPDTFCRVVDATVLAA